MASIINVNEVGPAAGFSTVTVNSDLTTNTLKLDTIKNKTGGNASTPDEIYSGRAKAWVNFDVKFMSSFETNDFTTANGGIRAAFNVSSVTDNGTGDYTVNFATSMPDANYVPVGFCHRGSSGRVLNHIDQVLSKTSSEYQFKISGTTNGTTVSLAYVNVSECYLYLSH